MKTIDRYLGATRARPEGWGGILLAVAAIAAIGVLSNWAGSQYSASLLYLIPILVIAVSGGVVAGVVSAAAASTIWLASDIAGGGGTAVGALPFWNASMRFGTFVVAVLLVAGLRHLNANLDAMVHMRTEELEAQSEENRKLERMLLEVSEAEQVRIGQDIHDGLCQELVGMAFDVENMLVRAREGKTDLVEPLERLRELLDDATTQARGLARGLYPVSLERDGLDAAMCELARTCETRYGVRCVTAWPEPMPELETAERNQLFRIMQEAVTNAGRHASAALVSIKLQYGKDGVVEIEVDDDGVGIDADVGIAKGMGLRIMDYRARLIGGSFHLSRRPGGGTAVRCVLSPKNREKAN